MKLEIYLKNGNVMKINHVMKYNVKSDKDGRACAMSIVYKRPSLWQRQRILNVVSLDLGSIQGIIECK